MLRIDSGWSKDCSFKAMWCPKSSQCAVWKRNTNCVSSVVCQSRYLWTQIVLSVTCPCLFSCRLCPPKPSLMGLHGCYFDIPGHSNMCLAWMHLATAASPAESASESASPTPSASTSASPSTSECMQLHVPIARHPALDLVLHYLFVLL